MWTLFFGVPYLRLGFSRRHEPLFIQVAIAGKLSFVALLFVMWHTPSVVLS